MEPERKIEKWLRSYAKKRRSQAKDSFDLHPATRRLLQGEIARKAPAPEEDGDSLSLWELLRQQWTWLLVFTACIFLIATIFMPVVYKPKEKAQGTLGIAELKQTDHDRSQAVAMNNLSSAQPETPALTEREMANAGNQSTPSVAPASAAPMSGESSVTESPPPSVTVEALEPNSMSEIPPTVGPASVATSIGAAPAEQPQPTSASSDLAFNSKSAPPAMTPPPEAVGGNFEANATVGGFGGRTAEPQPGPGALNSFQNSIAPAEALPVLLNFQVQQNGNALRIVDQDGSVYVGSWRLADRDLDNQLVTDSVMQRPITQGTSKATQTSAPPAMALADNLQAAQNYFFRVHGINRTLKQSVVFTGSLLANYALSENAQQSLGGAVTGVHKNEQQLNMDLTNQVAQLPWSNLRISGTAVINRTNHVEVNAAPATPAKQN